MCPSNLVNIRICFYFALKVDIFSFFNGISPKFKSKSQIDNRRVWRENWLKIHFKALVLTIYGELHWVLQRSIHYVRVLCPACQHLLVLFVGGSEAEDRLGDVADLVSDVVRQECVAQPPGHHRLRSRPCCLTLHKIFVARRQRLLQTDNAHVHGREDHVELDTGGEWCGDIVIAGGAGQDNTYNNCVLGENATALINVSLLFIAIHQN